MPRYEKRRSPSAGPSVPATQSPPASRSVRRIAASSPAPGKPGAVKSSARPKHASHANRSNPYASDGQRHGIAAIGASAARAAGSSRRSTVGGAKWIVLGMAPAGDLTAGGGRLGGGAEGGAEPCTATET